MTSSDGKSPLRFLASGERDLTNAVLGKSEGGAKLEAGLADRITRRYPDHPAVELCVEPRPDVATLLAALQDPSRSPTPMVQRMRAEKFDVVIISLGADLILPEQDLSSSSDRAAAFYASLLELIRTIKQEFRSHLIIVNACTVDPATHVSNFSRIQLEPAYVKANRLNLALIRASIEEGISIVDVDRLIGELGATEHVEGFLEYSETACEAICDELVRILEDYGFFDDRPLLAQMGSSSRA